MRPLNDLTASMTRSSSVATQQWSTHFALSAASYVRRTSDLPPTRARGLPGKRSLSNRAGITARTRHCRDGGARGIDGSGGRRRGGAARANARRNDEMGGVGTPRGPRTNGTVPSRRVDAPSVARACACCRSPRTTRRRASRTRNPSRTTTNRARRWAARVSSGRRSRRGLSSRATTCIPLPAREPANFDQLIISSAGPLTRGTSSDVWRPGGPRGRHTPSGARYPGGSPLRRFPRASAPSRSSARVPRASSPRQRAAGATRAAPRRTTWTARTRVRRTTA